MKYVTIICDFCGNKVVMDLCYIDFDNKREHIYKGFKAHSCMYCYDELYKLIRSKMIDKKKEHVRH